MPSPLTALRPVHVEPSTALTRPQALVLLQQATTRLAALHREVAQVRVRELTLKATVYLQSDERSASGREDQARYSAAHISSEYLDLIGERDAVTAEIDFLKQFIHTSGTSTTPTAE